MVDYKEYPNIFDIKIKILANYYISIDLENRISQFMNAWKSVAGDKCIYFKREKIETTVVYRAIFECGYTHFDDTTIFSLGKEIDKWQGPAFISVISATGCGYMEHNIYGKCNIAIDSVSDNACEDYYVLRSPSHSLYINTDSVWDIIYGYIPEIENEQQKTLRERFLYERRFREWSEQYLNDLMPTEAPQYLCGELCYDENEGFGFIGRSFPVFPTKISVPNDLRHITEAIDEARKEKKLIAKKSCFKIDWSFHDQYYIGEHTRANHAFEKILTDNNNTVRYIGMKDQTILRINISENDEKFEVINLN